MWIKGIRKGKQKGKGRFLPCNYLVFTFYVPFLNLVFTFLPLFTSSFTLYLFSTFLTLYLPLLYLAPFSTCFGYLVLALTLFLLFVYVFQLFYLYLFLTLPFPFTLFCLCSAFLLILGVDVCPITVFYNKRQSMDISIARILITVFIARTEPVPAHRTYPDYLVTYAPAATLFVTLTSGQLGFLDT